MELLRDYHAMFWAFFFLSTPPPPSSTLSLIQYLFFTAPFLRNVSCAFKKVFSSVFLSYTSCWKQSKKSKTKSVDSWTGFPRNTKSLGKKYVSLLTLFFKNDSSVDLVVKEQKHERTTFRSLAFWFCWYCIYMCVFLGGNTLRIFHKFSSRLGTMSIFGCTFF